MSSEPNLEDVFPRMVDHDLRLQLLEEENAQELYELVDSSRLHLRQWLPFVDDYRSVHAATDFIGRCQDSLRRRSGLGIGIWLRDSLAGIVTYDYLDLGQRSHPHWLLAWQVLRRTRNHDTNVSLTGGLGIS